MIGYRSVASADGTRISYSHSGTGPAIVVVPGNNRMAHNYNRLADGLATRFAVSVIDRRGRGDSGPQGADYSLEREIDDLRAVTSAEGARYVFGHSYGGLVALNAVREKSPIERLAVYEPGVSIRGSIDTSFLPAFERLLAGGHRARAMALFLARTRVLPVALPRPLLLALSAAMLAGGNGAEMRDLMSTTPPEARQVARFDSDGTPYAQVSSQTLLLGGSRSSRAIRSVVERLGEIIPNASVEIIAGDDHNAPDESDPAGIAERLASFFAA